MDRKPIVLTPDGHKKLLEELEHLSTVRRPEIASRIQESKEMESTANNAEYEDAKNEQAFIEGRIQELESMLKMASIVQPEARGLVGIGSKVTLRTPEGENETYTIVGSAEASAIDGKISNESPVGQALLGKKVGETVEVKVPAGFQKLKVVKVQ